MSDTREYLVTIELLVAAESLGAAAFATNSILRRGFGYDGFGDTFVSREAKEAGVRSRRLARCEEIESGQASSRGVVP